MSDEYPFGRAARSFFLGGATAERLPGGRPLLAYGANGAPERLAAKLPGVPVAALAGKLKGWTAVHSRHVSPYGAVPGTLVRAPGAAIAVHVLLLDDRAALDATEPNYRRMLLTGLELDVDVLGRLREAEAYLSRHGALLERGQPVALGARPQPELRRLVASVR